MKSLFILACTLVLAFSAQAECQFNGITYSVGQEIRVFDDEKADQYRELFFKQELRKAQLILQAQLDKQQPDRYSYGIDKAQILKRVDARIDKMKGLYRPYACAPLLDDPNTHVIVAIRGQTAGNDWFVF